jgi:hypothetical protein
MFDFPFAEASLCIAIQWRSVPVQDRDHAAAEFGFQIGAAE